MSCSACGASAAPGQRFCAQCGARLDQVCPACGAANPPGHRFCGACGAALSQGAKATPHAATERHETDLQEERRWATVLFADISGFTELAATLGPEEGKALARRWVERVSDEVERFGGTVLDVAGDEVFAVFGAPVAHEDDAERAVRAALAIRDGTLASPQGEVKAHVGVNTGDVITGQIGPANHLQYTVMGDTTNIAARLRSVAGSGSVLVGEETYRASYRTIRYRSVEPVVTKLGDRAILVWEALEAARELPTRPLVSVKLIGREDELAVLQSIWARVVRESRPHLVTIVGEAGIGKSRLVAELEKQVLKGSLVLHGRCRPYGEALGYSALSMILGEAAAIASEDDVQSARDKLGALVVSTIEPEGAANPAELARHLALLCGLAVPADHTTVDPDQRTLHASARLFFESLSRRQALCLIFEDIHWADHALLDLIELIGSRAREVPLLVMAQARPQLLEKRPGWGRGIRAFTSIPLEPLAEHSARELILDLCRHRGFAAPPTDEVARWAGGNPLFAEELVAALAERGVLSAIPSAIKLVIAARLDLLLPAERQALRLAAVFGKVFWLGGLAALGGAASPGLLEELVQKDLLRMHAPSQFSGEHEYGFKHDLIRDVAYEMLPRSERRVLHGRALDWLEQAAAERIEESLDILAHHAVESGQVERAIEYLGRAAERAGRAAAYREAAALLAQAVALAEGLGERERSAELRARRGMAFARLGAWAEARPELEAALEGLPQECDEERTRVLIELATANEWLSDAAATRLHGREALTLAERLGRDDLAAAALGVLALADGSDGKLGDCLEGYEAAFARAGDWRIAPLGSAVEMSGLVAYFVGRWREAIERERAAVEMGRAYGDSVTVVRALANLGLALTAGGRYREALEAFAEAGRFGQEHELLSWRARAISMSAWLPLSLFDFETAEARAEEAREIGRSVSFHLPVVSGGIDLILSFTRRQEIGRAEQLVREVGEDVQAASRIHGYLWRLRFTLALAELALARGECSEALGRAREAISQARASGRVKYEALGRRACGLALGGLAEKMSGIDELRRAVELARPTGDPALFVHVASAALQRAGDDALAIEARAAADRILAELPDCRLRSCFESAEPISQVLRLAS